MGNFAAQWVTMTAVMAFPSPSHQNIPTSTLFEGFAMRIVEEEGEEVISEQLIRSIWEVVQPPLKILLEVIIAPLRDLLHSYNFNHHQTN